METLEFKNSAEFFTWAKRIVKDKDPAYDRAPVGKQTWTYGDGHVVESGWGRRGGTVLANLSYMIQTAKGKMPHSTDAKLVSDIDARGGLVLTMDYGE